MKIYGAMACVALLTTACAQVSKTANFVNDATRSAVYNVAKQVQGLTAYEEQGQGAPQPLEASYCYRANSDIICYDEPKAHLSNKLVGYQGQRLAAVPVVRAQPVVPVQAADVKAPTRAPAKTKNKPEIGEPVSLLPRY